MPKLKDITGKKFNKLTAIKFTRFDENSIQYWDFLCECGTIKEIPLTRVKNNNIKSCGCLMKEATSLATKTHGQSLKNGKWSGSYRSWAAMKQRCYYEKAINYKNYGDKKIFVCDDWHKFENFYRDMGDRPKGKTLDRIDNTKNYSKDNCRWADSIIQIMNRKKTSIKKSSVFKGVSFCNRNNKFVSKINFNKKRKHLGYFLSEIEAAKAYNEAAKKYFGEFVQLNNI